MALRTIPVALPCLDKLIIDWQLGREGTGDELDHSEILDDGADTRDHPLRELELRVGKPRMARSPFTEPDPEWRNEMSAILDHMSFPKLERLVLCVTVDDYLLGGNAYPEDFRMNLQGLWRYPTVKEVSLEVSYKVGPTLEMECNAASASATTDRMDNAHSHDPAPG